MMQPPNGESGRSRLDLGNIKGRLLLGGPGFLLGLWFALVGIAPLRQALGWYLSQPSAIRSFPPAVLVTVAAMLPLVAGVAVLGLTVATVVPQRLAAWSACLLVVLGALLAVACFFALGAGDLRSWLGLALPAAVLVRLAAEVRGDALPRRVFSMALALAIVFAAAPLAAWLTYHQIAVPSKGELSQTSVSPDGRWQLRLYSITDAGFGPDSGLLRIDVRDLSQSPAPQRTVFVDTDERANKRTIRWTDADHAVLSADAGGPIRLDVAGARSVHKPVELFSDLAGLAAALGALLAVLVAGLLTVFFVSVYARARAEVRTLPGGQV